MTHAGAHCHVQFIQTPDEVPGSYGENYPRLKEIKRTFDPDHFFRHSMWPTAKEEIEGKDQLPDGLPDLMNGEGQLGAGESTSHPSASGTAGQVPLTSIEERMGNVPTEQRGVDGESGIGALKAGASSV